MPTSSSPDPWPAPGGIQTAATPAAPLGAEPFYADALGTLAGLGVPFLLAGTYALSAYTGIERPTKDLDIFCKPGDFPRILGHFQELGGMRRDRGRALDRQAAPGRAFHRRDLRLRGRYHAGERFLVRRCA